MRAGQRNRRITLQRATTTTNSFNEPVENWGDVATVFAQILAASRAAERFTAQQIAGQVVLTFRIRYRADIRVTDRIAYDGRLWNILGVQEVGRRVGTDIVAAARSEGGAS